MSADTPRATPLARYVAILIGLALLVLAVICGREIWLRNSPSIHWDSWVEPIVMTIGDATYEPWMLPAGFLAIGLGALLVWSAFRPRHRTHRRIRAAAPVWMRPVDISRTLCAAARTVPGVATGLAWTPVGGDIPGVATAAGRVSGGSAQIFVTGHREDLAPLVDAALAPVVTSLGLDLTVKVRQRPFVDEEERR